ncbi:hypothetical protein [Microbacterium sulfonylureivorans]|uniref:hypothetical protein n=1 Tax=Microbacterium sulfonylureivorans TaxID=2486854 RepID=UPI000FDCB923|nr:hypothetical protein [Microbacterium sulfonylureivorans]
MTRARIARRSALMASAALAAALVIAPAAASTAHAQSPASAPSIARAADAAAQPTLHVGVRQAAVGDPIPVTIVGAEPGTVWEIALAAPETVVGTVTVGDDGTGTTLVALPVSVEAGALELTAAMDGAEISTSLSSAGDTSVPAEAADAAAGAIADAPASAIASPLLLGAAATGLIAGAATAIVVTVPRRRRASA